jgi:tRNA-modifying protein YgfZ
LHNLIAGKIKMKPEWQSFLSLQGAQISEGNVLHFGHFTTELIAARDSTILCDLSQFGTLKVTGEEAQKYLQNLLSNDINAVNPRTAQLSSFNSPKGRMLATFLIWQEAGDYFLQLPHSLTAAMLKRLSMYVMRAKVNITDVSDEVVCLGLSGRDAAELIKNQFSTLPEGDWHVSQNETASVIRLAPSRYQINTTVQQAIMLWEKMAATAKPVTSVAWDWLTIQAGIPVITPPTQEQFVLQMTNLDILGGVSFQKGCYPGQEVVARTHYLGKQKRRMYLAHLDTDTAPVAGDELFSAEMAGQASGKIMNASLSPAGGYDVLAVLQISSREAEQVHLLSLQGPVLNFIPLPYSFDGH